MACNLNGDICGKPHLKQAEKEKVKGLFIVEGACYGRIPRQICLVFVLCLVLYILFSYRNSYSVGFCCIIFFGFSVHSNIIALFV